jgi:hypothetical protein
MKEVRLAKRWFDVANLKFFMMAAPLTTFLPAGPARRIGLAAGHAVDAVLTRVPVIRLWSWQFTFELVKRDSVPTRVRKIADGIQGLDFTAQTARRVPHRANPEALSLTVARTDQSV